MLFRLLLTLSAVKEAIYTTTSHYDPFGPGRKLSHYCPNAPKCSNNTHLLCEFDVISYYQMASTCLKPINVRLPDKTIDFILNLTSMFRSNVALGKEEGLQNSHLPRGYGMRRLEWDHQLATFAQIKANQCLFVRDTCLSTWRFPDASQLIGKVKYKAMAIARNKHRPKRPVKHRTSFVIEVVEEVLKAVLMDWYNRKKRVTEDIILVYKNSEVKENESWFVLVSDATHVGCGVSAYENTNTSEDEMLVICNFSAQPVEGQPVYQLIRPINSSECGCQYGVTDEDDSCLCHPVAPQIAKAPPVAKSTKLVLVPIIINKNVTVKSDSRTVKPASRRAKPAYKTVKPAYMSCEEDSTEC